MASIAMGSMGVRDTNAGSADVDGVPVAVPATRTTHHVWGLCSAALRAHAPRWSLQLPRASATTAGLHLGSLLLRDGHRLLYFSPCRPNRSGRVQGRSLGPPHVIATHPRSNVDVSVVQNESVECGPSVVGHLGVAVALTGVAIVATLRTKSSAIVTAQPFIVELKQRHLASHRS